jgi:hypothetical protein
MAVLLVVVEHRDLHTLAAFALDRKAVRRLDVFKVDPAERRFERGDHIDQLERIGFVELDVEHVDAGELLEEDRLAFHDRLGCERADIAQAQHCCAVGHHAHQIATCRETRGVQRIGDDLFTRRGHAGRVGQRQISLVQQLLGRRNRNFAGGGKLVVIEGGFAKFVCRRGHGGGLKLSRLESVF